MSVLASRHSVGSLSATEAPTAVPRRSVASKSAVIMNGPRQKMSRQLQHPHCTLVEYKTARFLITDQPNASNMDNFILTCRLHDVRVLVRVCEPSYNETALEAAGIRVVDLQFEDGAPPPDSVLDRWFRLIADTWQAHPNGHCVAVHCRAGLGRAPVLVAVALIELGMSFDEAIELIRNRRSGALNVRQIQYLKSFRSHKRLRLKIQPDRCAIL